MSYCVWQMWADHSGVLWPVKPPEEYRQLKLSEAQALAARLNLGPAIEAHSFQASSSVFQYSGPRPSKFYDVKKCSPDCGCERS
jgi:hypothetical protein